MNDDQRLLRNLTHECLESNGLFSGGWTPIVYAGYAKRVDINRDLRSLDWRDFGTYNVNMNSMHHLLLPDYELMVMDVRMDVYGLFNLTVSFERLPKWSFKLKPIVKARNLVDLPC